MPGRLVMEGGTVVTDYGRFRADVVVEDERVAAITADASGADSARQRPAGYPTLAGKPERVDAQRECVLAVQAGR